MEKTSKNNLIKKAILLENALLLLATVISSVLFLCGVSVGYSIFMISNYILYPLILLTFAIGFILKAVEIRSCKLNFILFVTNLAVSFVSLLTLLYTMGDILEKF